ncbi:MAG: PEP-utilizing enzyme [Dehalococcoidia bacterium]
MSSSAPADFHVAFANPEDAAAPWMYDAMHFSKPFPRLGQEFFRAVNREAFGLDTVFANGYGFTKNFAPPPPTAEVLERGVVNIWTQDFVPRIEKYCADVRARDYDSMTAVDLARSLPALLTDMGKIFEYTMIVVFPFMGPTLALVEFAEQALGPDGPMLVASLLQAETNETAAAGAALNDLVDLAASLPDVASALRDERFAALESVAGGPQFLAAFRTYLENYGWRADDWGLVHVPTWAENPRTPLNMLAAYLRDRGRSPGASLKRAAELRAAAEREFATRLDAEKRAQLQGMLDVAKPHVMISEGRAFWQLTIVGSTRVPLLALGRKLQAAGALDDPNDLFYLDAAELNEAAGHPNAATKELVTARKAEYAAWEQMMPPPFVGAPPDMAGAPPEVQSVFRRFFGLGVPPSQDASVVTGNAASGGVVRGRARVVKRLAEADALQPGEILVCTLTAPPWTPLFAIAAAVVTDTGGIMSHSAICAREFAIPCVVGTTFGTSVIPDGAMITVDGDKGTVRIEG